MRRDNSKIKEIFKGLTFSKSEIKLIENTLHKDSYQKGTTIIRAGDYVNDMYFIFDGCLRTFHTDTQGKQHTIQFGINDWWISDFTAFFTASKAIMNLEVLQDSILYRLSRTDRELLFDQIPKIESFIRLKLEQAYAAFQKRILSNLSQSASERYISFIKTYPDIEKHIKNYHIASYLGITTESLSRIRKDLSNS